MSFKDFSSKLPDPAAARIAAIACFCVAEAEVDQLIGAVHGTAAEPARWFVFGRDIARLGELIGRWQGVTELIVAVLPGQDVRTRDAALCVLEHERVPMSACVWLQGRQVRSPLPTGVRAARVYAREEVVELVLRLVPPAGLFQRLPGLP